MKILLWDYSEEFRNWFDQELNPDIDPRVIGINDSTKIKYRRSSGMIDSVCANTIYNKIRKYGHIVESAKGNFQCIMDLPIFKDWFNQELNPNIDPYSISISAEWPHIQYVRVDGSEAEISPRRFVSIIKKNGKFIEPKKKAKAQYCSDDNAFMKRFDTALNEHVNFEILKKNDKNTKLRFIAQNGKIRITTAKSYYANVRRNQGKYVDNSSKNIRYAIEDRYFRSFFKQELNCDVDLSEIVRSDEKTVLHYLRNDGTIGNIKPKTFFKNIERNNGIFIETHRENISPKALAIDDPVFKKWFNAELNPEIDVKTLSRSANVAIRYYDSEGEIYSIRLVTFFRIIERNNGIFVEPKTKTLNEQTSLHGRKKKIAIENPLFKEMFDTDLNVGVNLWKISCCDAYTKLKYYLSADDIVTITPKSFFENVKRNNGVFVPRITGRKVVSGKTDAATKDPEIELFWDWKKNLKKPTEISPNSGCGFYFICPYCGYEFTKRMKNIAGKSPKCPQCHDEFKKGERATEMPSNVAFLLRSLAPKEG